MIDTVTEGMNVLTLIGDAHVKPMQPLLKIMDLPNRGRGYVATQDIEAGTLIHVSDPLAMVVNQEWMPETCMFCLDFAYPKRMKIKALSTTEETRALLQWWWQQQQGTKNDKLNTVALGPLSPLRHIAFCTEQCKQDYLSTCSNDEWYTWLTVMYRLEQYNPQQQQQQQQQHSDHSNKTGTPDDLDDPATILHDDNALRNYLDKVWQLTLGSQDGDNDIDQDDFDDTDRTMCRFIATCLVKRQIATHDNDTSDHGFDSLWTMQDNELGHFRHFYQQEQQQQQRHDLTAPSISSITSSQLTKHTSTTIIPTAIKQTIQLYRHFVSAMTQPMTLNTKGITITIPQGLQQDNYSSDLFRAIYYREMANSFGLWEQQQQLDMEAATRVTDDLELLGFGIYPSAVYFNHACQANAVKLRHKSKMQFYTRQQVRKGDEVCISYGNVEAPLTERQQRLLDHYYFTCACTRCRLEQQ